MKVVLDTNVLVSGLITPFGTSAEIVRMIGSPGIILCVDARILAEYEEVLGRPRFMLDQARTRTLMDYIHAVSAVYPTSPLPYRLPDPDDEPFLEVALASGADALVTGNLRHYPARSRAGVRVMTPGDFLERLRRYRIRGSR